MKNYVQNVGEMKTYLDKRQDSVYIEESRPKNAVRIWLSYDVAQGHDELYDKFYTMFDDLKAEQWGNSVATFLVTTKCAPKNEDIAPFIVGKCIANGILDGDSFEDMKWKKTKDVSLYVFYRYSYYDEGQKKDILNSDHFVLLHNATITHLNGWK